MGDHFENFKSDLSPQSLYIDILENFKLENSLLNMLPIALKYKKQIVESGILDYVKAIPKNKRLFAAFGTIAIGITSYFYFKNGKKTKDKGE